jgi:hypothetical protein
VAGLGRRSRASIYVGVGGYHFFDNRGSIRVRRFAGSQALTIIHLIRFIEEITMTRRASSPSVGEVDTVTLSRQVS